MLSRIQQQVGKIGISFEAWQNENKYKKKKKDAAAEELVQFIAGDRVRHRKFGDGTVVSAQSFGNDAILVIDFDTAGTKRLMAVFAKLEKIVEE